MDGSLAISDAANLRLDGSGEVAAGLNGDFCEVSNGVGNWDGKRGSG